MKIKETQEEQMERVKMNSSKLLIKLSKTESLGYALKLIDTLKKYSKINPRGVAEVVRNSNDLLWDKKIKVSVAGILLFHMEDALKKNNKTDIFDFKLWKSNYDNN
jgi:hypothetical protein